MYGNYDVVDNVLAKTDKLSSSGKYMLKVVGEVISGKLKCFTYFKTLSSSRSLLLRLSFLNCYVTVNQLTLS